MIATDQEGGSVSRLSANPKLTGHDYPSPMDLLKQQGVAGLIKTPPKRQDLKALGINWNFARSPTSPATRPVSFTTGLSGLTPSKPLR
uniref:CAZy families GH3 protein n=1 Tax=uncultured Lactobacillus sp. TaxID=153152 RepID=A0A060CEG2_9LACO|nr:CAZy families GH3 protein [uncultured Lactobacillus sp.]